MSTRTRTGTVLRLRCVPIGGDVRLSEGPWHSSGTRTKTLVILAGISANFTVAALLIFVHTIIWPGAVAIEDLLISDAEVGSAFTAGDQIVSMHNKRMNVDIQNATQLSILLRMSEGIDTTFYVRRRSIVRTVDAVPRKGTIPGVKDTSTVNQRITENPRSVLRAARHALLFNPVMLAATARGFAAYFSAGHAPEITGVLGAAKMSGQLIGLTGASYILIIAATLNFSIGVMNLLPLPILDGGKVLITLIEKVIGRPVRNRTIQAVNSLSMAIIIAVLTITLLYDLNNHIF